MRWSSWPWEAHSPAEPSTLHGSESPSRATGTSFVREEWGRLRKTSQFGVCFGNRGLLDKRRGGISNTEARRSDRRCRIWELDMAGLWQVVCGCASGISDLSGSDQLSPILKQFCSSKFSVSLCGVTTSLLSKLGISNLFPLPLPYSLV